jgi:hypothetical protein
MNLLVSKLKQFFIFLFFALIFINVSDVKADSHDQLSESLKQSLTIVINENVSEDLQKAIAKYAIAISQNISDKNKTTLLQSTKEMLSISSNENINDFKQIITLLNNLEKIIDIIYPHILEEMDNQNIPNDLQINAWLAFSDLKTGIKNLKTGKNFDQSQIKNSLEVISKALVADSITKANQQEVAEKVTKTDNRQNNINIKANYNIDNKKEVIGIVQKSGKKGLIQTDGGTEKKLKKRDNVKNNTLLTCIESSTGCQMILDKKTSFYLESGTQIIINSYYVDGDGTQFIKACLLDGGFYFKTLRKINSQVTINIINNGRNFYDAIMSKGPDAKFGVSKEDNVLDVVNAGGTNVNQFRMYSENADMLLDNINTSNIEDMANMFEAPKTDFLPSITNANGDPCININFGDISVVQEISINTCSHNHAHVDGEDQAEPLIIDDMLGSTNEAGHQDEFDAGYYDLGENCNPDIVIPYIICADDFSCTLRGEDPKKDPNVNPGGPSVDPGGDHHSG